MKKITRFYKKITFLLKKKIDIDIQNINSSSLEEIFTYYGTDKATNVKNQYDVNSDLIIGHGYSKFMKNIFHHLEKLDLIYLKLVPGLVLHRQHLQNIFVMHIYLELIEILNLNTNQKELNSIIVI